MNIDINRVNLLEKDIEDWVYECRTEIPKNYHGWITHWFGRQYQLPSGIADLIGMRTNGVASVIEVKNVPINKAAITQVCRYAADLRDLINNRMDYPIRDSSTFPYIEKVLIGPSIDAQTFGEAKACDVEVIIFTPRLQLSIRDVDWTDEYSQERDKRLEKLAENPEWEMYGKLVSVAVQEQQEAIDDAEAERYRQAYLASMPQPEEQEEKDMYDKLMDEVALKQNDPEEDEF